MCKLLIRFAVGLAILVGPRMVEAFDPPVDQQGPLTIRIDGPAVITDTEHPFSVSVHLKNSGTRPVQGMLRLSGIDRWKCAPGEAVPFSVDAESESTIEFQVTPHQACYAALYPLHARAEFDWDNAHYTAHPILIVDADVEQAPASTAALPWLPFAVRRDRSLALWQMPVHRSVVAVFGHQRVTTATGWTGQIQTNRAAIFLRNHADADRSPRDAIAIHPPWADGQVGTAWVEYPLTLPAETPIKLRFATAVSSEGKGDGVTFRVRAVDDQAPAGQAGDVLFERHSGAQVWEAGVADLSTLAGRTVRLQLESHPGPDKNTSYDQSYWAEPLLTIGTAPVPRPFPPPANDDSADQVKLPCGDHVVDIRLGLRGLLDADVGFVDANDQRLWFRGFEVRVHGIQLNDASSPAVLNDTVQEPIENGVRVRHHFITARGEFDLVGDAAVHKDTLRVRWMLENAPPDQPWLTTRIESLSSGPLSHVARRVYAGHGNVIEKPEPFELAFDGHRLSTSFVGLEFDQSPSLLQAVDLPPDAFRVDPRHRRYSLQTSGNATFTFIPGSDVWQMCRQYRQVNGLQAAAGVDKLAGRFVFDLWGGRYAETTEALKRAFHYGLTDSVVVWHNWQRWGYDYRLPEIYPPHTRGGTEAELQSLIAACREQSVFFALHDNYIDFYPDAEGFSYADVVAFNDQGGPVKAWLNESRQAQSYRFRADRVAPFLRANLQKIHGRLAPTSYFIDVWSSIKPYDYWTSQGRYFDCVSTRDSWRDHFAWIRNLLGDQAPQISESGHDQLIGWLDGAQTNHLRVGKPAGEGRHSWSVWNIDCADAERTPWFDAVHHDRFILHGAGYSDRYQAGLDAAMHGIYSDDYVTTELLTGHPAMVKDAFGRDAVRKYWLTHDTMHALALQTIEQVTFVDDDLHRQRVRWSEGGQVWVNRGDTPWNIGNVTLPTYGFLARIPTANGEVSAAIYQRDGLIVEQAQSAETLYVNARSSLGNLKRIRPQVNAIRQPDSGTIELDLVWEADEPIPNGFRPFVHFVDQQGEIMFQASSAALPWRNGEKGRFDVKATAELPQHRDSGDSFELRVGLYHPELGGRRLSMVGNDDGEQRIRLGTIRLTGDGDAQPSIIWTPHPAVDDPYLRRINLNAQPIDFGWIVTRGGCRLTRHDSDVLLTPLPEELGGIDFEIRWDRLPWKLPRPTGVQALSESGNVLWERPLGESILIQHDPQVFAYRFHSGR